VKHSSPFLAFVILGTIALTTVGFQCASPEVATARKAIQAKDFPKAQASLEKALAAEPNNCEALLMLGDVKQQLNDVAGAVDAWKKARACPGIKADQSDLLSKKLYNIWVGQYNAGISKFNDYFSSKSEGNLDAAATNLRLALDVKPEFTDPLSLLGQVLEAKGDTNTAITTYTQWWDAEKTGFELLQNKGVVLGTERGAAIKILGTPTAQKVDTSESTVLHRDKFDVGGRDLYVFSAKEASAKDAVVEGWTYNPPTTITEDEKWRIRSLTLTPIKALAYIAFSRGDKSRAFDLASLSIKLKPSDPELVPMRTQLLQDLGKSDEALQELKALTQREPKNVMYRLQYASLLASLGRSEAAITEFKAVLEMEAKNETALYNLGAEYKNLASAKQREESEKANKDRKYKPSDVAWMGDLQTSARYFETLRQGVKYRDDLIVMEQLANIYEVRRDKQQLTAIIAEFEALEQRYADNADYWRILEGIYARQEMLDKMKRAQQKAESIK